MNPNDDTSWRATAIINTMAKAKETNMNYADIRTSFEQLHTTRNDYMVGGHITPATLAVAQTRQSYTEWVAQWKADYKKLSGLIAAARATRKPFKYTYRAPAANRLKRRIAVGPNPYHQPQPWGQTDNFIESMSDFANLMLAARSEMKPIAYKWYLAERDELDNGDVRNYTNAAMDSAA